MPAWTAVWTAVWAAGVAGLLAGPACAARLEVGPAAALHSLGDAMLQAHDGDTIHLAAGEYFECARVRLRNLVLEGDGAGTVLTDKPCDGKALLVVQADNMTVRNLVLARVRVADRNGAGIRLEAQGLVLDHVTFENDEVGLLAGEAGPGEIRISDCRFVHGGEAGERPSYAVLVGGAALLRVERTSFIAVRGGQISSGAARTALVDNRIETGVEAGAGNAVLLVAGALEMRDNVLAVGPNRPPRDAAVLATGGTVAMRGTTLENSTGHSETMLVDWTGGRTQLADNRVSTGDTEWSSAGQLRHRLGSAARSVLGDARAAAGMTKRALQRMMGR